MEMRKYVASRLSTILGIPESCKLCQNFEKCIFNWAVRETRLASDQPSWENPTFKERYKRKFLSIQYNLLIPLNTALKNNILSGKIKPQDVMHLKPDELYITGPVAYTKEKLRLQSLKKESLNTENEHYEGIFKCGKCKSNKTSYYQMQTRSADEPMTTFITCMNCDNRWKC